MRVSVAQYELNLRDYLLIFRRRKIIIILSCIIFAGFGGFYNLNQVPVYEVSTTVKIEERKTIAGLLTEWIAYSPGDVMETQAKVIKGFPILKKVALNLDYINQNTPSSEVHKVVQAVSSHIATERVGNTNIIKITVTSTDPLKAVNLANTVAKVYVEENLLEKNKQARTVRQFVEEQLNSLKARLETAEDKLKAFGEDAESIWAAEPIQKKLIELEFQLASLQQKYTDKHPKIIQIKEQIRELKEQIKGSSGEELEYARLKREVEVNRKLYGLLKENLEQARITEAEKVSDVSILDPAVMPTAPLQVTGSFGMLLGGIMGLVIGGILAFVRETLDTSIGKIEDVEKILNLPVIGVIPSIEREFKKRMGFISRIKSSILHRKRDKRAEEDYFRLIAHYKPMSFVSESFRNIRTNLKISPSRKTFMITSSQPQEGKTLCITNLSLITAQEGTRTLLVSSDLRRPAISRSFKIKSKPGLTEVLSGTAKLKEAIRDITDIIVGDMPFEEVMKPSGLRSVWLLPSGDIPANPAELLASKEMGFLVKQLREEFDVVFFDSPPILPVTDASLLAPLVDSVILCYEVGRTSRDALLRAKIQLEGVNANIQGVILNNSRPQAEPISAYPYYRYRYRYYHEESSPEDKKNT